MMQSDYFALSACAFSVLYVPFLIISQLRFAHIMQNQGYDNRAYFRWIKKNFLLACVPLIGISGISLLAEAVLITYLRKTSFYEMAVIVGYLCIMLFVAAMIALVFTKYIRCIKIESEITPIVCSGHLVRVFLISSFFVCAVTVLENLLMEINEMVFFIPLMTPLFVPLTNWILKRGNRQGKSARPETAA